MKHYIYARSCLQWQIMVLCSILVLYMSCGEIDATEGNSTPRVSQISPPLEVRMPVTITSADSGSFPIEMQTNGNIRALKKVEMKLRATGRIEQMSLRDGDYIEAGDLILKQEDEQLLLLLEQEKVNLGIANVALGVLIIGHGGEAEDTNSVDPQMLKNFKLQSGWETAAQNIKLIEFNIRQTQLYTPIGGWVSDLKMRRYQEGNKGEAVCTLIDPSSFELHFPMVESNAFNVRVGQPISFYPLAQPSNVFYGKVSRFNPVIDENGLLTVIATVNSGKSRLREGMKVRVIVEQQIEDQIIVPRSARVIRSNRDVIFIADTTTNLAKWKYIEIAYENTTHLAIADGLESTDIIIVSGNLNLDHDVQIKVDSIIRK